MENANETGYKGNFPFKCHYCQRIGHKKSNCFFRQRQQREGTYQSANNVQGSGLYDQDQDRDQDGASAITFLCSNEDTSLLEQVSTVASANNTTLNVENVSVVQFVIDSGATNHLIGKHLDKFVKNNVNICQKINVAKEGETLVAEKEGCLYLHSKSGLPVTVKNVWVCENLMHNLLSVRKLEECGFEVSFKDKKVYILKNKVTVLEGNLKGNLYIIDLYLNKNTCLVNQGVEEQMLIHRKMGHSAKYPAPQLCEICLKGKQTRLPFVNLSENRKPSRILEVVSTDLCGPINPETHDGKRYFLTFVDHYSHFCICYLLTNKNETLVKFKEYVSMVEAKFTAKIYKIRCDNGGEYSSQNFKNFCKEKGIKIQYTVAYNPEQNGVAERYNRTIMEKARCMLYDSNLDKSLWGEAVRSAVYLINRLKTRGIDQEKCPAEIWYQAPPNLAKIKLFGCTAYNLIPKQLRTSKLDPHCKAMTMVGYADNGYRLWDETERKIVHARNVIFEEVKPKFAEIYLQDNQKSNEIEENKEKENTDKDKIKITPQQNEPQNEQLQMLNKNSESVRRSTRAKQLPSYLKDFELSEVDGDEESNLFSALSVETMLMEVSNTYKEAEKRDDGWLEAVQRELHCLEENATWDLVRPPEDVDIIDSKWVFREKLVNSVVTKRARLVARGYQQTSLSEEVYAPVVRMSTIRVLLCLYLEFDLNVRQLDVSSAFLNGTLNNPVYMKQPEGLNVNDKSLVCKLKKALYGLKQAPKCWNSLFNTTLLNLGFQRSMKDPCLYFTSTIYLLIHVDDMIMFSKSNQELDNLINSISKSFKITELTNRNLVFLGL